MTIQKTYVSEPDTTKAPKSKSNPISTIIGAAIGLASPIYFVTKDLRKETKESALAIAEWMQSMCPNCDTFENTKDTINKIVEETGLKDKGLKLNIIEDEKGVTDLKTMIESLYKTPNAYQRRKQNNWFHMFSNGANAGFFHNTNTVVIHKNLHSTAYHEIGHALNKHNGNFINKVIIKGLHTIPHGVSIIAPIALAVGLLHKTDKTKPQSQKDVSERSLDFVSNNAGKLTFAGYLPLLLEEASASHKGLKLAFKHLPVDTVKKLANNYAKAYSTYLTVATVISAGVALGVGVKNAIDKHFEK